MTDHIAEVEDFSQPDWEGFGKTVMSWWSDQPWLIDLAKKHRVLVSVPNGFNPLVDFDPRGYAKLGDSWFIRNYEISE